ncbi:unnamed protein product [Nippostrongylus brasiliensis]|uniref:G_PROTEIN_RECEP_F1_2 domain-containing protein n=1 Tax=Nippostrongylus brasiliensis TaxID=27835 RepID=A0A0N4YBM0_NIPBR|nr:unnamed protein product [Nippostrongylus brasiliensis]
MFPDIAQPHPVGDADSYGSVPTVAGSNWNGDVFGFGGVVLTTPPPPPPRDFLFWLLYACNLFLTTLNLLLNVLLLCALVSRSSRRFYSSFYIIMLVFVSNTAVSSVNDISTTVLFEGLMLSSPPLFAITLLISLATSFYSTVLIFLLGLSRFAVFCHTALGKALMKAKTLLVALVCSFVFSLFAGCIIYKVSGFSTWFDEKENTMLRGARYPTLLTVSCYMFYAIPLLSTVFYGFCFVSLRSQRLQALSGSTTLLLNRAEKNTLKQGVIILTFYLISLVIHIYLRFNCPKNNMPYFVLSRIEIGTSTIAQLTIPISTLAFSKDIRHSLWLIMTCAALQSSSLMQAIQKIHRIRPGSVTSERKNPK